MPLDIIGRFYNPEFAQYGSPHSASDAVYVEGLVYAYQIAKLVGDKQHVAKYGDALNVTIQNLLTLQYKEDEAYFVKDRHAVLGALRFNAIDNRIRTDTAQHTLDAFEKYLEVFSAK